MIDKLKRIELKIDTLIQKIESKGCHPSAVGIDLSGSEKRPTGISVLQGKKTNSSIAITDEEIISKTIKAKPSIISIDSPLGLPEGRCCSEDSCECRKFGIMRVCERILKKRGVNVYPSLIPSMQKLTMRGINLTKIFKEHGFDVIESYPGAAQDILGFPRKGINLKELEIDLMNMGIVPSSDKEKITHDELDALTSALVGYFHLAGMYEAIGNNTEGYLIIPNLDDWSEIDKGE